MQNSPRLGGTFSFPGTSFTVHRMGYGAMQLAGPHVFGPPRDREAALAVLRAAVEAGVNHIDTAESYGPHVTNQLIREALHPYPEGLVLVTKVGTKRGPEGSWDPAQTPAELVASVEENLRSLGVEALDVVNFRVFRDRKPPTDESIAERFAALAELQQQGKIRHLGLSHVTLNQVREASGIAPVVCVQNMYNLAIRGDDELIDSLHEKGIPFVPYFPLGGFSPLQVALAWLLHRSPNILLIPGTSSMAHLHENLAAADLQLSPEVLSRLDSIGKQAVNA